MIRLRVTALPVLFETTSPTRDTPGTPEHCTITTPPERRLVPSFSTRRKSRGERRDSKSGSETLPTFEPTRFDDAAPGPGLHAMTEAVTALSPSNLGLVSPLHDKKRGWRVSADRLRILVELCQSSTSPAAGSSPLRRTGRSAKKRDGSRKECEGHETDRELREAWQTLEKPYPTWVLSVERRHRTLPHRRIPRSCGAVIEGRYSPALTLGA